MCVSLMVWLRFKAVPNTMAIFVIVKETNGKNENDMISLCRRNSFFLNEAKRNYVYCIG